MDLLMRKKNEDCASITLCELFMQKQQHLHYALMGHEGRHPQEFRNLGKN